eukprot:TRINITY_DN16289_c0_g1_i1.p1 TRINITY_DN16289_c0_g1~~TRINITY_DN16289_c0_g1_i1.p1  ORF type:complete len:195 (-),score=67.19 TRINITY_DN16289_c0_g1_i1:275-814(-)
MGVAEGAQTSQHLPTMLKPCLSLLVLVSSSTCSLVKYLGVPGYSHEVVSPSLYPVRTALDALQPSLGYGYGQGYGYGYPWGLNGLGFASSAAFQPAFLGGFSSVPRVVPTVVDSVDVAQENTEEVAGPVVTIQHNIDALPIPPQSLTSNSKFRNPIPPPIPAGIVQATQPTFGQVAIRV